MSTAAPSPTISIIVVNWNTRDLLAACIRSVQQTASSLVNEIIVVDNASSDDSCEMLRRDFPEVTLIENRENVGFAGANNQAARLAQGKWVFLLNSDAELQAGALQALLTLAESAPRVGIVGAHLINPDGSFQASYSPFPSLWSEFLILSGLGRLCYGRWYPSHGPETANGPQKVDYVEGAALLIRGETYLQMGGLDEGFFMYAEEVDLCRTFHENGWEVYYHPEARILHHGGGSSTGRRTAREGDLYRSRVRFFRKHYGSASALALKTLIYFFTTFKIIAHGILRKISRGTRGRAVISLHDLSVKLKGV